MLTIILIALASALIGAGATFGWHLYEKRNAELAQISKRLEGFDDAQLLHYLGNDLVARIAAAKGKVRASPYQRINAPVIPFAVSPSTLLTKKE